MTDFLRHMLDEVAYLAEATAGLTREAFLSDETLQRAFARSIEVVGEATKQIPPEWRDAHRTIDWRAMAGMRDHLIHGHFGVDYEMVWDVASVTLRRLRPELERLIAKRPRE